MTGAASPPRRDAVLLHGGIVFDGDTRLGAMDVLVRGGRISEVGRGLAAGEDVEIVDCRDHTVMPGLIDAHVHVAWAGPEPPPTDVEASLARATRNAGLLHQAGVTTCRDTGGPLEVLHELATGISSGSVRGPHIVHSGRILCAPGGHGTEIPLAVTIARECDGPRGFRQGVLEQLAGGARYIKVALNGADDRVELAREELQAAVEEAHAAGVPVACHASVRSAVALAVECGVDTIEHGNGLDQDLARRMADQGTALVPTTAIFLELQQQLDEPGDTLLSPEQLQAHRRAVGRRVSEHAPAIEAALSAGVTIGLGTDRVPGGDVVAILAEALALRSYGLTMTQILHAATAGSAQALGLADHGRIRVGTRADIAVFGGDVTGDLDVLGRPVMVFREGTAILPQPPPGP